MMTDTVFQPISYIRPGRTKNSSGETVPTGMRYTFNLNVPLAVMIQFCSEQNPGTELDDAQKENLVETFLKNGATYVDCEGFKPGYVVEDAATGQVSHWQFFKNNRLACHVHYMDGELSGAEHGCAALRENGEMVAPEKPFRKLSDAECEILAAVMQTTENGRYCPLKCRSYEPKPDFID